MQLVTTCEEFSTYRLADGQLSYLTREWPFRRYQVDFDSINLETEYRNYFSALAFDQRIDTEVQRFGFVEFLRAILTDPDIADWIRWCIHCSLPSHEVDTGTVYGDDVACDACISHYFVSCTSCGTRTDDTTGTLEGDLVCESCNDDRYSFCDDCDGYYHHDNSGDHQHDEDGQGCCASPGLEFFVRNDGEPALAQDTLATINLPSGTIDAEGIQRLFNYLYAESLYEEAQLLEKLGGIWQTREGNFTKRFSRMVYKELGKKVSPEVMSNLGTIGAEHSKTGSRFNIRVTRDLNRSARDMGNSDSCWWQSYSEGRCALKSNGGFGLLAYHDAPGTYDYPSGRAWVLPLKLTGTQDPNTSKPLPGMKPTFDTMTPDAFVVFNGYGNLSGWAGARVLAHMAGMTYRKVGFGCEPMYVNSDCGYLVAPEDIADQFTDRSIYISVSQHSNLFNEEQAAQYVIDLNNVTYTVREHTHA